MATARRRRLIRQPEYADPSEVAARTADMPDAYVYCRGILKHRWEPVGAKPAPDGNREVTVKCSRCDTEKRQVYTWYGARIGNARYKNPDGYQMTGVGILDEDGRDAVRAASLDRLMGEADPNQPASLAQQRRKRTRKGGR